MICSGGKGATAWEWQVGFDRLSIQLSWVHLSGGRWTRWRFWRRPYIQVWGEDARLLWSSRA